MSKENCRNFDSDDSSKSLENSSENDVHYSYETSSQILLHHKKGKVMPIKYSSDEENDVEIENVDNLDDDWIEIESDDDDVPSRIPFTNINRQIFGNVQQPIDYFTKFITNELITENINSYANVPSTTDNEDRLDGKLHILQHNAKGKRNNCLVCSTRKLPEGRKTTVYFCETYSRKPFLHVGDCFKKYHTLKAYK
jgi:hypothetical protein